MPIVGINKIAKNHLGHETILFSIRSKLPKMLAFFKYWKVAMTLVKKILTAVLLNTCIFLLQLRI